MPDIDWSEAVGNMNDFAASGGADDHIDEILRLASVLDSEASLRDASGAAKALVAALGIAESPFLRADVAHALAMIAPISNIAAVDALTEAYGRWRQDQFLAPELLHALAVLAERDALARSEAARILLRLPPDADRYLLVRAAKVITRLESLGTDTGCRAKLEEWARSEDPAVEAEARQQAALLALQDALAADDLPGLEKRLELCRVLFARAEISEEQRSDAQICLSLVDLLLSFFGLGNDRQEGVAEIMKCSRALKEQLYDPRSRPWIGYSTGVEQIIDYRLFLVAESFERIARKVGEAKVWVDMTDALVEVAAAFRLMVGWQDTKATGGLSGMVEIIPVKLVLAKVGPLVDRAIERQRFERLIENYEAGHGTDETSEFFRLLLMTAKQFEHAGPEAMPSERLLSLFSEAARFPESLDFFLRSFPEARILLRENILSKSDHEAQPNLAGSIFVASEYPACLGNHPRVDETVRPLIAEARNRLGGDYPPQKWHLFVHSLISVVQFALRVRDDLPKYTLCNEDGGLGQRASEKDLQKHVFERLSDTFGTHAIYEFGPIAGGRTDSGLKFDEMEIPMEFKAEFRDVSQDHVRQDFLSQSDQYATERDRVAFLLVLDLRESNSGQNLVRRRAAKKSSGNGATDSYVKMYALQESFWIDGAKEDPQIAGSKPNAIVVGLFPGNRTKPSSMTDYSARPKQS